MAICLACKIEYQPKADYQKLCYKCYFESQPQKKNLQEEILASNRIIYVKLTEIQKMIQEIEIQELKTKLSYLMANLEKILEKQNDKSTTTS